MGFFLLFIFSIVLSGVKCNGNEEGMESQLDLLKHFLMTLGEGPLNSEDQTLQLANLYQTVKNLSNSSNRPLYFSRVLPVILRLEDSPLGINDTRFTRLFFNACHCVRVGLEDQSLVLELLGECMATYPENISTSRYYSSVMTAYDQVTAFKCDYVLPGDSEGNRYFNQMVEKLKSELNK